MISEIVLRELLLTLHPPVHILLVSLIQLRQLSSQALMLRSARNGHRQELLADTAGNRIHGWIAVVHPRRCVHTSRQQRHRRVQIRVR